MKNILMIVVALIFISGCAAMSRQAVKTPDQTQRIGTRECVETDYKGDGSVFIKVNCPERIIHAVTRLKPGANYAVFIGNDPMMIVKASADGILVFVNQFGRNVEIIPKTTDEEMKKIKGGE